MTKKVVPLAINMETGANGMIARRIGLLIILIAAITWLPWLSLPLFNTKGEPREAIVAVSMLKSGNWILPLSMGADIPYKPPMLAWLIALFSLLPGHVTEFTSRLPSAIAAILLVWSTWRFFMRYDGRRSVAALASLLLMTSIEVWRAGSACRVDMVLTAATVGAFYCLYGWIVKGMRGLSWGAAILMTIAVLTKGPVGFVMPCLCVWIYNFCRPSASRRQWSLTWKLALTAVISCLLPAVWYFLAAREGGNNFLALVYEENIGRATGTMSYASHEKGAWYNFVTLATGMLPYTVACIMAAFAVEWRGSAHRVMAWWRERNASGRPMATQTFVFSIICSLTVLVFFTIPKSKRSVYLLPMYPFVAYMVTLSLLWLADKARKLSSPFTILMSIVAIIIGLVGLAGPLLPQSLFDGMPGLQEWMCRPAAVILAMLALATGAGIIMRLNTLVRRKLLSGAVAAIVISLWTISAGILPGILNVKSDKPIAEAAAAVTLPGEPVYQFVDDPMLRYYTANFYLDDRIRIFSSETAPDQGVLMVSEKDFPVWKKLFGVEFSAVEPLWTSARRSCDTKSKVMLIPFVKKNAR